MSSRLTGGKVIQDHPLVGVDLLTIHSVLHTIPEACVPLGPIIINNNRLRYWRDRKILTFSTSSGVNGTPGGCSRHVTVAPAMRKQ